MLYDGTIVQQNLRETCVAACMIFFCLICGKTNACSIVGWSVGCEHQQWTIITRRADPFGYARGLVNCKKEGRCANYRGGPMGCQMKVNLLLCRA